MKVVAIIQARMGSTRLPGKVLRDIAGETMLARVVRRVQLARMPDAVVVATTLAPFDDAIVAECVRLGVPAFRGSEQDVLDRYWQATCTHQADVIVRITADCPLIDPRLVDYVVAAFLEGQPDYASNVLERTYPRGLDTEVMAQTTLEQAWQQAGQLYQRAHVTPYIYQNPNRFRLLPVKAEADHSYLRWTVDTATWRLCRRCSPGLAVMAHSHGGLFWISWRASLSWPRSIWTFSRRPCMKDSM
jgi:spore coat polysaccharide biosynthesis protein SpsF